MALLPDSDGRGRSDAGDPVVEPAPVMESYRQGALDHAE